MQYNNFANSAVVGTGWAVVRDTMNIGFVIVLLVIAFGTIIAGESGFGGRFNWKQNLPRLLIFAILINFSRMLCGLMIDFGQVVMLTFVNAIRDVAGGNFIQLFGLQDIISISSSTVEDMINQGEGLDSFWLLASAFAAAFMMGVVFLTLIFLCVILVIRIVTLWILVVLSPIAFFLGGAEKTLGSQAGGMYAEWWKNFTSMVLIGPVLVFFLWLALAVAGSGSIAASEGFTTTNSGEAAGSAGIPLAIFEMDKLISFVIGIGLLWAGFDAAGRIAGGMPGQVKGIVSSLIKPQDALRMTQRLAMKGVGAVAPVAGLAAGGVGLAARGTGKVVAAPIKAGVAVGKAGVGVAKWGAKTGYAGAKWGAKTGYAGAKWGAKKAKPYATQIPIGKGKKVQDIDKVVSGEVAKAGDWLKTKGVAGRFAGRYVKSKATTRVQSQYKKEREDAQAQMGNFAGMTKDEVLEEARRVAVTPEGRARQRAARLYARTNGNIRRKMSTDEYAEMVERDKKDGADKMWKGDKATNKELKDADLARIDAIKDPDRRKKVMKGKTDAEVVKGLDSTAISDDDTGEVWKMLDDPKKKIRHANKDYTGAEYLEKFGTSAQKAAVKKVKGIDADAQAKLVSDHGHSATTASGKVAGANHATKRYWAENNPEKMSSSGLAADGGQLAAEIAKDTNNPKKAAFLREIEGDKQKKAAFLAGTAGKGTTSAETANIQASSYVVSGGNLSQLGSNSAERRGAIDALKGIDAAAIGQLAAQSANKTMRARNPADGAAASAVFTDLFSQIDSAYVSGLDTTHGSAGTSDEDKAALEGTVRQLLTTITQAQKKRMAPASAPAMTTLQSQLQTTLSAMKAR